MHILFYWFIFAPLLYQYVIASYNQSIKREVITYNKQHKNPNNIYSISVFSIWGHLFFFNTKALAVLKKTGFSLLYSLLNKHIISLQSVKYISLDVRLAHRILNR